MMLAQMESVPSDTVKNVALIILAILGGIYYVREAFFREKVPQPLETKKAADYVPKYEFEKHVEQNRQDHDHLHSKIGGVDRGNGKKISDEVTNVHNRVNAIEKSIGGLEVASDLQSQRLAQIDAKIDRLIERR